MVEVLVVVVPVAEVAVAAEEHWEEGTEGKAGICLCLSFFL